MASWPPKKNAAFVFYVGLVSQTDTKLLQANPTLAAGDVKVATDDAAPANLATLPVVDADFTDRVKVNMSADEMNGDRVTVIFSDAAGAQWTDLLIDIPTSVRQIDDLAFPTVTGRSFDVLATGEVAPDFGAIVGTLDAANIGANAFTAAKIAASALDGKGDWNIGKTGYAVNALAANTISAASIAAAALNGKGDWNIGKTGYSVSTLVANVINAASIAAAALNGKGDWNIGKTGYTANPAAGGIVAASFGTGAINAAALAADAANKIRDAILPEQNVALNNLEFLFVSSSDHVTPITSATGISVTRSIDGAAFVAATGTVAEVGNGIYQFDASAADMNGGIITFRFVATGGSPVAPDASFLTVVTGAGV